MATTIPTAIRATDLRKTYGDTSAVDGVSFEVAEGEIFGYLGRNGSGKTTTVRMLTTLTRPTGGSASVAGFDVVDSPMDVKRTIGVTMQDAALDPQMTGSEHLVFVAGILGHSNRAATNRASNMLELFGLTEAAARPIGGYSGGMKRRLDIATALLGEPRVLFLDEPTTGLDPQSRRALWDEIRRLKQRGVTVFLTTQYLEEADLLTDHLAVIDRGRIIAQGTAAALKSQHGRKRISLLTPRGNSDLVDRLGTLDGGCTVRVDADRVIVEVGAEIADLDLMALVDRVVRINKGAEGLALTDTSLEDVFLRLTGSGINDTSDRTELAS